jgi:hypothetical protein
MGRTASKRSFYPEEHAVRRRKQNVPDQGLRGYRKPIRFRARVRNPPIRSQEEYLLTCSTDSGVALPLFAEGEYRLYKDPARTTLRALFLQRD